VRLDPLPQRGDLGTQRLDHGHDLDVGGLARGLFVDQDLGDRSSGGLRVSV